ncbi:MAG: hypothetical protein WAN04_07415, partial [Candidatus Udaeobacter sp.]
MVPAPSTIRADTWQTHLASNGKEIEVVNEQARLAGGDQTTTTDHAVSEAWQACNPSCHLDANREKICPRITLIDANQRR